MITFKHFDKAIPKDFANASVAFADNDTLNGISERDAEGNITVKVNMPLDPEDGDSVFLVLHAEKNSEYRGTVTKDAKAGVFVFGS